MIGLAASNVTLRLGERTVLTDISLRIEPGEFIALVGPNGAGKSSLLTVLAGLRAPDTGTIALDEVDLKSLSLAQLARRRAYLPQNPRCDWPLTVERLVGLGLTAAMPLLGPWPRSFSERITAALAASDLTAHRSQPVDTLSGGEFARAMLARAMVGDPQVLIVDEPTAGLDPKHALDTVSRLARLARSGKIVIAAIHDLTLAARHADRICALSNGQVAADGPPGTTLTVALIRTVFDVDACLASSPGGLIVDYLSA